MAKIIRWCVILLIFCSVRAADAQNAILSAPFICQWANIQGGCPGNGWDQGVPDATSPADDNCGPTSVLMVASKWSGTTPTADGISQTDVWLQNSFGTTWGYLAYGGKGSGTEPPELASLAKNYFGLTDSTPFSGWTLEQLKQELAQGYPVIVRVRPQMVASYPGAHYMVLLGMDQEWVYVNDPGIRNGAQVKYKLQDFIDSWAHTAQWDHENNEGVVVHPNGPALPPRVTVKEYALPTSSSARDITVGPDGALWFAETGANRGIGRITTNGVVSSFPNIGANGGIARGPDSALWFTEWFGGFSSDEIGRISTAGVQTKYPVPTLNAFPNTITVGPDGALWFTEYTANKIGRITTSGTITEYPVPTAHGSPATIVTGPDGALWFTESTSPKVGRITTSGVITEFDVPSYPWGITKGPDGALWFTEPSRGIGRITTSGSIAEYSIPTVSGQPLEITVGPDGALWFTEESSGKIGRITTNGSVIEYIVTISGSQPYGIILGPDGALWFTEQNGNHIGQVILSAN